MRTKLLGFAVVGGLAVACITYDVIARLGERTEEVAALHALRSAARSFSSAERVDEEKLLAAVEALAANGDLRRAFVARDRDGLLRLAKPTFDRLQRAAHITHWYFIAPDQTAFLRVHAPEKHGDRIDRVTLALAQRTGESVAGKGLGRTAFALRVVQPYRDASGALLGYMELAEEIDHFLARMKEQSGDDFALVVKKRAVDEDAWREALGAARNTWNDRPEVVVVSTTTYTHGLVDYSSDLEEVPDAGLFLETTIEEGRALARGVFPVRDATGEKVGALFVLHDVTEIHDAVTASRTRSLFVLLALGALSLVALAIAFRHVERATPRT